MIGAAKISDTRDALVNGCAQGTPMFPPRGLNIFQRNDLTGVFFAHRTAKKLVTVENPNLGEVARIVPDGNLVSDIARQGRMAIAESLKVDTVAPHDARLGMHDEQQIEIFEVFGQTWQESVAAPGIRREFRPSRCERAYGMCS